jgi:hypothetical protein
MVFGSAVGAGLTDTPCPGKTSNFLATWPATVATVTLPGRRIQRPRAGFCALADTKTLSDGSCMVVMAPAARSHHFQPVYVFPCLGDLGQVPQTNAGISHRQSASAIRDSGRGPAAARVTVDMLCRCVCICADLRCVDGHLCEEP